MGRAEASLEKFRIAICAIAKPIKNAIFLNFVNITFRQKIVAVEFYNLNIGAHGAI
jgi:hypothetical protein